MLAYPDQEHWNAWQNRLGYGRGFFDRTLAALERKPLVIGVGFESQALDTIRPLAHDIPMDVIITQAEPRCL